MPTHGGDGEYQAGGFVIIPLMQADAVGRHWMTSAQFLNAVALGQITPGPVVQTVAAVAWCSPCSAPPRSA